MKTGIFNHKIIKILTLVAVVPLLIGHAVSPPDSSVPMVPLTVSGSADPGTSINVGDDLLLVDWAPPSAAGGSIVPVNFSVPATATSYELSVWANVSSQMIGTIGEMWAHLDATKRVKLIHPAISPSFLIAHFFFQDYELLSPQSSTNASSSGYVLSSSGDGSGLLTMQADTTIYVNNIIIFQDANPPLTPVSPIMFNAVSGDTLRIVFNQVPLSTSGAISSIWLIAPNGNGIKLLQSATFNPVDAGGLYADVSYALP